MALETSDRNKQEGKATRLLSDAPPDEAFRKLFVTRESHGAGYLAEAKEENFWPTREPTPFEIFFLAENQRSPDYTEAEEWAKKLNQGGRRELAEFLSSGATVTEAVRIIEKETHRWHAEHRLLLNTIRQLRLLPDRHRPPGIAALRLPPGP